MKNEKRIIIIDNETWEIIKSVYDMKGEKFEQVILESSDGKARPATICRETKQIWFLYGRRK